MANFTNYDLAKESPLVSVIINCFNGDQYLHQAIKSVIDQTYQHWEIVLWDNFSTVDIKKSALSFNDPRIKYHRAKCHTALGEARNLAIALAKGEYLAFLDCDDLWMEDKLLKQVQLFARNDQVVLVYTDVESFNASGNRRRHGEYKNYLRGCVFGELLKDYFLVMSSVMIKSEAFKRNNITFNPRFQMVEEADVFLRMALFGKVDYVSEVLSCWRVHGNSVTWRKYDLIASESGEMIEGLLNDFPELENKYDQQFEFKKKWILRQKILALWLSSEGGSARALIMQNYRSLPLNVKIFYFITWFSPRLISRPLFYLFGSTVYPA